MARKAAAKWFGLVLIGAAAFACVRRWRQHRQADGGDATDGVDPSDERPNLTPVPDLRPDPEPAPEPPRSTPAPEAVAEPDPDPGSERAGRRWVPPIDGDCPPGHPVKVNERSGIYHVPGGQSYDRTSPTRCYPDEAAAEADGFRRSKR